MIGDRGRLYAASVLRSSGVAIASAVLAVYLDKRGLTAAQIGVTETAGLAGGAFMTGLVGYFADHWGRKRTLLALSALGLIGGLGLASVPPLAVLAVSVFLGMVNGMGHDRGGAYALEQSILSHEGSLAERTWSLTVYHAVGDVGSVAGSALVALVPLLGYRNLWWTYSACMGAGLLLYPGLSREAEAKDPKRGFSPETRGRVYRFAGISAIDSFGSGFLTSALLSYYFYKRFGLQEGPIAALNLGADVLNIASNFLAERIARRIGLVNTMVFTHLPASLLLMLLPFCPTLGAAVAVFLLRELLVEMDVPTRQSYLASIIEPRERTAAFGLVQLTRTSMWAMAPVVAGWMMGAVSLATPLYLGASIKAGYDVLMWRAFRKLKPRDRG
ncbi:MAG TPA: MFS transporter [Elusimicrobiota bacterium]|nr:MFS transporter [Elusimicrobiota bacterium]